MLVLARLRASTLMCESSCFACAQPGSAHPLTPACSACYKLHCTAFWFAMLQQSHVCVWQARLAR